MFVYNRDWESSQNLKHIMPMKNYPFAIWLARAALGLVFVVNVYCALVFILQPQNYAGNFEISGVSGEIIVQSFGILFLMWNATYPPVLLHPDAHRTLFGVILAQQLLGLTGETWLLLTLPAGHPALYATGLRFIVFDGFGLLIMTMAYVYLILSTRAQPDPDTAA